VRGQPVPEPVPEKVNDQPVHMPAAVAEALGAPVEPTEVFDPEPFESDEERPKKSKKWK
jgi:hypothetical protein